MSTTQSHEQYVASMLEQFDAFIQQAIQQWPHETYQLASTDFSAARYELLKMMNSHGDNQPGETVDKKSATPSDHPSDADQYLPVTPAPWP